jgi:hypothetical protein
MPTCGAGRTSIDGGPGCRMCSTPCSVDEKSNWTECLVPNGCETASTCVEVWQLIQPMGCFQAYTRYSGMWVCFLRNNAALCCVAIDSASECATVAGAERRDNLFSRLCIVRGDILARPIAIEWHSRDISFAVQDTMSSSPDISLPGTERWMSVSTNMPHMRRHATYMQTNCRISLFRARLIWPGDSPLQVRSTAWCRRSNAEASRTCQGLVHLLATPATWHFNLSTSTTRSCHRVRLGGLLLLRAWSRRLPTPSCQAG